VGEYKKITSMFDARYNMCREIEETGKVGTAGDIAVLFYMLSSAWWGDKFHKKEDGVVDSKFATQDAIVKYTGLSRSTVFRSLKSLREAGWILMWPADDGGLQVQVLLTPQNRRDRDHRRKLAKSQSDTSKSQIDTRQSQFDTGQSQIDTAHHLSPADMRLLELTNSRTNEDACASPSLLTHPPRRPK